MLMVGEFYRNANRGEDGGNALTAYGYLPTRCGRLLYMMRDPAFA